MSAGIDITDFLAMTAPFGLYIYRFWGAATYMFVQVDFINLLFNMLWLFAFGRILCLYNQSSRLLSAYLTGGLTGALFFLVFASFINAGPAVLIGSSAAVLGVIAACGTMYPRVELNLFLFGYAQLRWIALGAIILCGLAPGFTNLPSLAAHAGGAVSGWALIKSLRFTSLPKAKTNKNNILKVRQQERRGLNEKEQIELDNLLSVVKKTGYKSLSIKQQRRLFELSDKISKS